MVLKIIFLNIFTLFFHFTEQLTFLPKVMKLQKYTKCPEEANTTMNFLGTITEADRNKFQINGVLAVFEEIGYPVEMEINVYRCDLDMSNCNNLDVVRHSEVCKRVKDKNRPWTKFFESIEPPLICPLKAGFYTMINSTLDMSMVTEIPGVENYAYISYLKLYDPADKSFRGQLLQNSKGTGKDKRVILCVFSQVTITPVKIKRNRKTSNKN